MRRHERQLLDWKQRLKQHWAGVRFGQLKVEIQNSQFVFEVQVYLNELDPDSVSVELYADAQDGACPLRQQMQREQPLVGSANSFVYSGRVPANRPVDDFTPRLIPSRAGTFIPMEAREILWQR
jgi:starch phosphorylase